MDQDIAKDRLGTLQEQLAVVKKDIEETTIVIGELDIQLKELNQEKPQVTRTEEDVYQQLLEITKQLNELNIKIEKSEVFELEYTAMISKKIAAFIAQLLP